MSNNPWHNNLTYNKMLIHLYLQGVIESVSPNLAVSHIIKFQSRTETTRNSLLKTQNKFLPIMMIKHHIQVRVFKNMSLPSSNKNKVYVIQHKKWQIQLLIKTSLFSVKERNQLMKFSTILRKKKSSSVRSFSNSELNFQMPTRNMSILLRSKSKILNAF